MNLDDMKAAWQQYDVKLQSTQALSDKIITSMIKDRSQSRLAKVKRHYLFGILYLIALLFFSIAVLAGNPFDYTQLIEYIPIGIYSFCMFLLVVAMIKFYNNLQKVEINSETLEGSLKKIISLVGLYETPKRYASWALKLLLFTGTVLFPLSFLPRKILRMGLAGGIVDTLIAIAISAAIVFIAHKLGAFKGCNEKKFKEDLAELEQLKATHSELLTGTE